MILECPSCHARYLVQIGLFAQGGRHVRCARCKHGWHATLPTTIDVFAPLPMETADPALGFSASPPSSMPGAAPSSSPFSDAVTANLPAVIRDGKWKRHLYSAIGGIVALSLLISWPILDRQQIVRVLPSLRGVYETLGFSIEHSSSGLIFDQVTSELRYDGGTMKLYVDGIIHNTTPDAQFIPDIKARALGADGRVIQSWWVEAPAATVAAGSDTPFHTEVNAPMKRTIENVNLEFFTAEEKKSDKGDAEQ